MGPTHQAPYTSSVDTEQPMTVDLSRYVDKKIIVTFRNGTIHEGKLTKSYSGCEYPYSFKNNTYLTNGHSLCDNYHSHFDIIDIQLKSEPKYAELERQVAEMQAEIERLKAEENTLAEYGGWKFMKKSDDYVKIYGRSGLHCTIPTETLMNLAKQLISASS